MTDYVRHVKKLNKQLNVQLGSIDIELTERCNNNCLHCCINLPENDRDAEAREMTTGQVKTLLSEAAELGCLQVRFTGGEPLLRADFEGLYIYARRLGMKVLIFTNARLITARLAELLTRIPPLVTLEVTVYGMSQKSYEAVSRVSGSYAQFKRGITLLQKHQIPFVVKGALLPPNRHELDEFEAWAKAIPWMMKTGPGISMFFDLRNRCDSEDRNRQIKKLRPTPAEGLAVLTWDADSYRNGMEEFGSKFMGPPGDQLFRCGAGRGLCIDAYGIAQPCMGVRTPELTFELFNGQQKPFAAALKNFSTLSEIKAANPDYLKRCAVCFLKGLCEQCPAKSWAEYGNLDTPVEYLCAVAHAQARWLGWLHPDEYAWESEAIEKFTEIKKGIRESVGNKISTEQI